MVRLAVSWMLDWAIRRLDVDVGNTASFWVLGQGLVFRDVGVFADDVPGVEKAGKETKTAEGEVDERINGTEPGLDPDCGIVRMRFVRFV